MGRTQKGNNNAYCQDNEISWIDWNIDDERRTLIDFTADLIRFRLSEPVLRRRKYFQGRGLRGVKDLAWLTPDAGEMNDEAWTSDFVRCVGMLLSGDAIEECDEKGEAITGDTLLVLFNAHTDEVPFTMPELEPALRWQRVIDTMEARSTEASFQSGDRYPLRGRSVAVFRRASLKKDRRLNGATSAVGTAVVEPVGAA
jgi:glycogen operon protein